MRTFFLLTILTMTLLPQSAMAKVRRMYSDSKLPTQQMVEKQTFTNPAAAGTTNVLSASAGPTTAAVTTVSSFVAQPDVPRNLVITPGGTTGDIENCDIVVSGTSFKNQSISETFAFLANASSATTGAKAFKTVTSVVFPANCESGGFAASWSIGYGEKLGLKECMGQAGHIFFSTLNGSKEGTAPTMAVSSSAVESNTSDFNGAMNGSNDFELFFMQNFGCL